MYILIALILGFGIGIGVAVIFVMKRYDKATQLMRSGDQLSKLARHEREENDAHKAGLVAREQEFAAAKAKFDQRVVSYRELQDENRMVKRDLQNVDVLLNKFRLDNESLDHGQKALVVRTNDLCLRYLEDTVKAINYQLTTNNFSNSKQRLLKVIGQCRSVGYEISAATEEAMVAQLQAEYELLVKAAVEREEQARIKARIREEARLQREAEEELARLAREKEAIQRALDIALHDQQNSHAQQIDELRAQLAEAEAKSQRALSMAQQTKAGNVYVISNVGSFGEGVFKVGMTRRLDPYDRIWELGDASVPFPFDVHMMISCDDAPTLENALHKALHKHRLNKVNPRKEFFRSGFQTILDIVSTHHGKVEYKADPEALEYRQSQNMPSEDAEFIEAAFDDAEEGQPSIDE